MTISKNRLGLTLGIFAGAMHLIWALLVLIGVGETYMQWILPLHFLKLEIATLAFSIVNALMLVVLALIGGYVLGWLLGWVWNWTAKWK